MPSSPSSAEPPAEGIPAEGLPADVPAPTRRHVLPFDPRSDGFAFSNTFRWTDEDLAYLAHELRPLLRGLTLALPAATAMAVRGRRGLVAGVGVGALAGLFRVPDAAVARVARRWSSFGLCGGMALAAAERWPHEGGLATSALQPQYVRALLRRRQARTVRAAWPQFLRWWFHALAAFGRPLEAAAELEGELARIRARLDAGHPVVVGLAGDAPDLFALHQVVAFGYEETGPVTTLLVYDPNAPGRTRHLRAWTADGYAHVATDLPTGPKGRRGYHIHREPGRVAMLFAVDPDAV